MIIKKVLHQVEMPSLSKILDYIAEEDIMAHYLGEPLSNSTFCNPFRQDSHPSCTVSMYNGKLTFKDWSLNKSYSIVGVAGLRFGIISLLDDTYIDDVLYYQIVDRMYTELVKGKELPKLSTVREKEEKAQKSIRVEVRPWEQYDLDYWGIPKEFLSSMDIYPLAYAIVSGTVMMVNSEKCPTYGYYFREYSTKEKGVWKLYSPTALQYGKIKWLGNHSSEMVNKTWK